MYCQSWWNSLTSMVPLPSRSNSPAMEKCWEKCWENVHVGVYVEEGWKDKSANWSKCHQDIPTITVTNQLKQGCTDTSIGIGIGADTSHIGTVEVSVAWMWPVPIPETNDSYDEHYCFSTAGQIATEGQKRIAERIKMLLLLNKNAHLLNFDY